MRLSNLFHGATATDPIELDDSSYSGQQQQDSDFDNADLNMSVEITPMPRGRFERRLPLLEATTPFGDVLRVHDDVELEDETFLRVSKILAGEHIRLQGIRFHSCTRTNGMANHANELCAIVNVPEDDSNPNPALDSYLSEVSIDEVVRKRIIIVTNVPFAGKRAQRRGCDLSFRDYPYQSLEDAQRNGVLVCRWKAITYFQKNRVPQSHGRLHLTEAESEIGVSDMQKILDWCFPELDLRSNTLSPQQHAANLDFITRKLHSFPYSELFAGAGGVTRAAKDAGFHIKKLVDHDSHAYDTLRRNFPAATVIQQDVHTFLNSHVRRYYAHVHMSPPCPEWSTAKRCPSKNDANNIACSFAIHRTIEKLRPRTVTIENVKGLHSHFKPAFWGFVQQLTDHHFSVRVKIIEASSYGHVEPHARVIIHAACPGETVPPFKKATHGQEHGLPKPNTIRQVLSRKLDYVEPHMLQATPNSSSQPYSADGPLRGALLCNTSGGDHHPDGCRSLNMQERALCKGFLPDHLFTRVDPGLGVLRRLTGNAVPHCMALPSMQSAYSTLQATNEQLILYLTRLAPERMVIEL